MDLFGKAMSVIAGLAIGLSSLGSGCVGPGVRRPILEEQPPDDERAWGLAQLADTIDPQQVVRLRDAASARVLARLPFDEGPIDAAFVESSVQAWDALPGDASFWARLPQVIVLARLAMLAEGNLIRGVGDRYTHLFALERLYRALDRPLLGSDRNAGNSIINDVLANVPALNDSEEEQDDTALLAFMQTTLTSTGDLHRHTAAQILREFPDDAAVIDVLDRVADGLSVTDRDRELAIEVRSWSVHLRGRAATSVHWLALADACYQALAVARGDDAVAQSRLTRDQEQGHVAREATLRTRAWAVRALELAGVRALPERLERAALLLELDHVADAERELDAIVRDHPDDARAHLGRARHVVRAYGDVEAAYEIVAAAPAELEHRDRAWYQLAIAMRATHLYYAAVRDGLDVFAHFVVKSAPELAHLRADILALEALGSERAKVLRFVLEVVDRAGPVAAAGRRDAVVELVGGLLPRALRLLDETPQDTVAYGVALAAAVVSRDRELAFSVLDRPIPSDPDGMLGVQRIQLGSALAVTWGDDARLPALARAVATLPASVDPSVRTKVGADVDLVAWRLGGDAAAADRAIRGYQELVDAGQHDVRVLENLAVLHERDVDRSRSIWQRIVTESPEDADAARVHLAATAEPPDLDELQRLVLAGEGETRRMALRWLAELAPTAAAARRWRAALRGERRAAAPNEVARIVLPDESALGLRSEAGFGVGYELESGLVLQITATRQPRAFVVPTRPAFARGRGA